MDVEIDLRIVAGELAEHRRQAVQADVVAGANRQAAADLRMQLRQRAPRIFDVLQRFVRVGQQRTAGVGQADAAADAVKQRLTNLRFERGDALADRRLRQVQPLRSQGEGAFVGDADEGGEQLRIHGAPIHSIRECSI